MMFTTYAFVVEKRSRTEYHRFVPVNYDTYRYRSIRISITSPWFLILKSKKSAQIKTLGLCCVFIIIIIIVPQCSTRTGLPMRVYSFLTDYIANHIL